MPVLGATPLSVTVPTLDWLPVTVLGDSVMLDSTGGFTVSVADSVTDPNVPVIVATF